MRAVQRRYLVARDVQAPTEVEVEEFTAVDEARN
jgi:hypothetical protein